MSTESARIFNFSLSTRIKQSPNLCPNHHNHGHPVYSFKVGAGAKAKAAAAEEWVWLWDGMNVMKDEEDEQWVKMGKLRGKCKGRKAVVELLECLEREAIMGDDAGKEPIDYNRRAHIFNKSSRVFQALKIQPSSS